jgi:Glycosyl transferase family 2
VTDLHIVSWNRPRMTELVIRTIHRNTVPGTFRVFVIDNGSESSTQAHLLKLKRRYNLIDKLILWDENHGLEAARHEFLYYGDSEFFVDIDNDCLPPPAVDGQDWLSRQLELINKYDNYAAISQRTQVMIGTGEIFEEAEKKAQPLLDFPHPGGSFRLMHRRTINEVGGWDRKTPGRGSEEKLICGKLQAAGYKTAFAVNIRCQHLFGTRGSDAETDRWGYDKHMKPEDSGHSDISHPALSNGDSSEETMQALRFYCGDKLAGEYLHANDNNKA